VLARLARASQGSSATLLDASSYGKEDRVSDDAVALSGAGSLSRSWHFSRGRSWNWIVLCVFRFAVVCLCASVWRSHLEVSWRGLVLCSRLKL
jgi:hypothetical protein